MGFARLQRTAAAAVAALVLLSPAARAEDPALPAVLLEHVRQVEPPPALLERAGECLRALDGGEGAPDWCAPPPPGDCETPVPRTVGFGPDGATVAFFEARTDAHCGGPDQSLRGVVASFPGLQPLEEAPVCPGEQGDPRGEALRAWQFIAGLPAHGFAPPTDLVVGLGACPMLENEPLAFLRSPLDGHALRAVVEDGRAELHLADLVDGGSRLLGTLSLHRDAGFPSVHDVVLGPEGRHLLVTLRLETFLHGEPATLVRGVVPLPEGLPVAPGRRHGPRQALLRCLSGAAPDACETLCRGSVGPACVAHGKRLEGEERHEAREAYRKACEQGYSGGCLALAVHPASDEATISRYLRRGCVLGHPQACARLADRLPRDLGRLRNRARQLNLEACGRR